MKPLDFIRTYEQVLATQQWKNVNPLMHEDVCVTFSNGAVHKGKAAVKIAFERNFELIKSESYQVENVHWVIQNEAIAVFLFEYKWSGYIDGELMGGAGKGTSTLVFENDKWLLLTEHLGK